MELLLWVILSLQIALPLPNVRDQQTAGYDWNGPRVVTPKIGNPVMAHIQTKSPSPFARNYLCYKCNKSSTYIIRHVCKPPQCKNYQEI